MEIAKVGPAEEEDLRRVAEAVEADLRYAGLPVTQRGNSFTGFDTRASGAVVFYDPSDGDASGGGFVSWRPSPELMDAAVAAGTLDSRPAVIGGAALDAMLLAIKQILMAAGWAVDAEAVGVHDSCLKVLQLGPAGQS